MKKSKKLISICLATIMTMSAMCISAYAKESSATVSTEIGGNGEGVNIVPPALTDTDIEPYGSSPPKSNASVHNLDSSDYDGNIEWMGSLMYSNKWLKTKGYKVAVWSNLRAYDSKQNAINGKDPITVTTQTKFRLVGSDGSKTSWQAVSNTFSGTVTFGVTPNVKYYLEISPVSGYYTAGEFSVSAVD